MSWQEGAETRSSSGSSLANVCHQAVESSHPQGCKNLHGSDCRLRFGKVQVSHRCHHHLSSTLGEVVHLHANHIDSVTESLTMTLLHLYRRPQTQAVVLFLFWTIEKKMNFLDLSALLPRYVSELWKSNSEQKAPHTRRASIKLVRGPSVLISERQRCTDLVLGD